MAKVPACREWPIAFGFSCYTRLAVTASSAPTQTSSTPILDRLIPPPPPLTSNVKPEKHGSVGFVIAAIFLIIFMPSIWISLMTTSATVLRGASDPADEINQALDPSGNSPELLLLWHFCAPVLAAFVALVVHELGHVIAGKLVGFQLVSFHIGRLQITPPFRLEWHRTHPLPGAAGFVRHLPVHIENLRFRDMAVFAGGPSANLLSALVMLLLPPLGLFSICFGAISFFYGVVNLIPLRPRSDGQRILKLLRNTREQERALAVLQLMVDLRKGTKPEDLEPGFLGLATAIQDNSVVTVHGHQLAYLSAYYRHDDAEAARLLEICLQHSHCDSPRLRESLFGSAVDFQANRRKRVDLARQWLADIPEKPLTPGLRPHMEASILEGEGDIQGALKKLDEAETAVRDSPGSVEEKLILRFFCRWRKELEEKLAATT